MLGPTLWRLYLAWRRARWWAAAAALLGFAVTAGLLLGAPSTASAAPSESASAAPSESASAWNDKGAALFKRKQYVEASAAFERAYAIDPRDFRVLRYAVRC